MKSGLMLKFYNLSTDLKMTDTMRAGWLSDSVCASLAVAGYM